MCQQEFLNKKSINLKISFKQLNCNNVIQTTDTDRCCDTLTNILTNVIQKFTCPFKLRRKQTLPWITNEIYQLMKKRDNALKKSLSTKLNTDDLIYKGLRNQVVTELRKAKTNYFMQLINTSGGNSSYL